MMHQKMICRIRKKRPKVRKVCRFYRSQSQYIYIISQNEKQLIDGTNSNIEIVKRRRREGNKRLVNNHLKFKKNEPLFNRNNVVL